MKDPIPRCRSEAREIDPNTLLKVWAFIYEAVASQYKHGNICVDSYWRDFTVGLVSEWWDTVITRLAESTVDFELVDHCGTTRYVFNNATVTSSVAFLADYTYGSSIASQEITALGEDSFAAYLRNNPDLIFEIQTDALYDQYLPDEMDPHDGLTRKLYKDHPVAISIAIPRKLEDGDENPLYDELIKMLS